MKQAIRGGRIIGRGAKFVPVVLVLLIIFGMTMSYASCGMVDFIDGEAVPVGTHCQP